MIKDIYDWTINWAATDSAEWALGFIAFAESSFFPIPPDVLMMAMAIAAPHRAFVFALIASLGSVLGGVAGYGIGRFGGRPVLEKFVKAETIARVQSLFHRYDAWAIAIAGFTPIPYKVFTIASGAFHIQLKTFILASFIGRAGRFFVVASLFYFWGEPIKQMIDSYFSILSLLFVALLIGGFSVIRLVNKEKGATS